jgi:DUF4097 and DUF4098 domain-containing protein YvlB
MNEFSFPRSPQGRSSGRHASPILFLCLVCFLGASPRQASADEFSKVSNYFLHLVRGTVMVDTRVGDVTIEGWDKDRVEVQAEKVVRAGSEKESRRLFDRITVRLIPDEEGRTILVKAFYPPRRLWRPFRGESRLSVNFHIKMPNDSNLELKCVDGDITVRGVTGNQRLKVNYGNVEIDVPSVWHLRLLRAHTWLGYVQSDLHTLTEQDAGVGRSVSFVNPQGRQEIRVHVRMGGVWIYGNQP